MKKVKLLKILGTIWVILFAIFFAIGILGIVITEGIGEALEVFSPFNIASYIVNIVCLSPAIFFFWLANKLEKKKST